LNNTCWRSDVEVGDGEEIEDTEEEEELLIEEHDLSDYALSTQ